MKNIDAPQTNDTPEEVIVDDRGRIHRQNNTNQPSIPAPLRPVYGVMTVPTTDRAALYYMQDVVKAALKIGHKFPDDSSFVAGQVFYKGDEIEEVRLALIVPGTEDFWTTSTEPQVAFQEELLWNPEDEGRPHFSAVLARGTGEQNQFNLHLLFNLRPKAPVKPTRTPPIIDESLAMLPNGKADRDFQAGLLRLPNFWGRNEEQVTRYFNGSEGHVIEYQPSEVAKALGDAPERALEVLERGFSKIKSEAVADVIDILFHHWAMHKDPATNSAFINAARLCEYRNKTTSGENLELHWHALRDAFSFSLRDTKGDLKAQLFFSESKGEGSDGPGARYAYSPGFMLQYALQGQPLYFAPFLQKVWELDPVRNNEAKRLARVLRADWRMNTEKYLTAESGGPRAARWHSWAFLLDAAGVDTKTKGANGPKRLIEKMTRAVETLYDMEVIAEGNFDIYHPDDREKAENLPTRGALDVWLSLRVCLAPSAALREALLETDNKRRAGRARDVKALATERARKQLRTTSKAKPKERPK